MFQRKGFTLIELLIVVAIIAVLITILAPALRTAKELATQSVCLGNQMALSKGYVMYAEENKSRLPVGFIIQPIFNQWKADRANNRFYPLWCNPPMDANWNFVGQKNFNCSLEDRQRGCTTGAIYPYVNNVEAYHCPGDRRLYEGTAASSELAYRAFRSYSFPDGLIGEIPDNINVNLSTVFPEDRVKKLSQLSFPETKYSFLETTYDMYGGANYDYDGWSFKPLLDNYRWWDPLGLYHVEGITMSFLDGHAKKYKWKDDRTVEHFEDRGGTGQSYRMDPPPNQDIEWFVLHYPIKTPYLPGMGP